MSGKFDSMSGKFDSHLTKRELRPQILVKLSYRELCNSKLSGLRPFYNMTIKLKKVKNRKLGCEFIRHQTMK